ncbi:MAG: hypothetical protein JWR35_3403 [Marmoricola sp.]|jgi:hypothetical protein|nr:hypothetical protein [Marmoricola sp.]
MLGRMSYSPMQRVRRKPAYAALAIVAALSLGLSACGGSSDKAAADKTPASQPTEGGKNLAALWPLTGLPSSGQTPKHPVMIVKIDNTTSSQPQLGLAKADLITEELVEGGITRLAVFFYSKVPDLVGPVRSMRASDIGVVKPAHAVLVASGAAGQTIGRLNRAKVRYYTEGAPGFYRDSSRHAPYNLMVRLPELAKTLKRQAVVPASYLPWGKEADFAGGQKARTIAASFSATHTTDWTYAGGKYTNTNSNAAAGSQLHPDTVLVLRVREGDAGYLDPAGNHVPETLFTGKGALMLFHNGQLVRGTWSKKKLASPLALRTAAGSLKVPAGHVWIELVPDKNAGGNVTWTK